MKKIILLIGLLGIIMSGCAKPNIVRIFPAEEVAKMEINKILEDKDLSNEEKAQIIQMKLNEDIERKKRAVEAEKDNKLSSIINKPVAPLRTPDTILRVLILPYEDDNGVLNGWKYSYVKVDDGKWIMADYLNGTRPSLRGTLTPLNSEEKGDNIKGIGMAPPINNENIKTYSQYSEELKSIKKEKYREEKDKNNKDKENKQEKILKDETKIEENEEISNINNIKEQKNIQEHVETINPIFHDNLQQNNSYISNNTIDKQENLNDSDNTITKEKDKNSIENKKEEIHTEDVLELEKKDEKDITLSNKDSISHNEKVSKQEVEINKIKQKDEIKNNYKDKNIDKDLSNINNNKNQDKHNKEVEDRERIFYDTNGRRAIFNF